MNETSFSSLPEGCVRVQENLGLRGKGILTPHEEEQVEEHLAVCPPCADEALFVRQLERAIPAPPMDLGMRILAKAIQGSRTNTQDARPPSGRWGRTSHWRQWAAAAAILLAVIAGATGRGWVDGGLSQGIGEVDPLAFVDPDLDAWAEDWFVAGAPVLEGLSDETLYLLALEMTP